MDSFASTSQGTLWRRYWNPYVVGALIGALSWAAFAIVNQPIGMSTAISQASGAAACLVVDDEAVAANAYWKKFVPRWDYGTLFLAGTFGGALVSAIVSRRIRVEVVPQVWRERFGSSPAKRLAAAFLGGVLAIYGARLAGGCTSGHGVSGTLQLALSSWTFFVMMFAAGIATALLMFRTARGPQEQRP